MGTGCLVAVGEGAGRESLVEGGGGHRQSLDQEGRRPVAAVETCDVVVVVVVVVRCASECEGGLAACSPVGVVVAEVALMRRRRDCCRANWARWSGAQILVLECSDCRIRRLNSYYFWRLVVEWGRGLFAGAV